MKNIYFIFLAAVAMAAVFVLTNKEEKQAKADTDTIYVATNGSDQNVGTKSKPFRTLKKAASEANAGTTILIRKGVYHEKLIVKYSGTDSKPIIFEAYNKEKVILSGKNMKDSEEDTALVTINNKNYVTISGVTIQDLSSDLEDKTIMGIYVTGTSSHITLKNNKVQRIETHTKNGNAHGIAIYGTGTIKDINILNNTLQDLKLGSSESLVLNGNIQSFKVENNIVRRSDNIGIDLIGYEGTSNNKKLDYVRNGIVKNNIVYDVSSYSNPAYGKDYSADGIYVDGGKNITIEQNTIYKSDIGIEATSEHAKKYANNINIINNTIYENFYTGISIGGYDKHRGGTINSTISQNILYRNDTKGLDGGQLLLQYDTKNNVIERNILTAGPSRIFISNYFTTNQKNKLQKNVFHKEQGKIGIWIWKEREYKSFPEFLKASNSDKNSSYIDPRYYDANKYDFRLKKDSPAQKIVF